MASDKPSIIIVGGGGHALSVADSIHRLSVYDMIGYTDLRDFGKGLKYIGDDSCLKRLYDEGVSHAAICVGYMGGSCIRDKLYADLKQIGFDFPIIVDPSAILSDTAKIDEGTFIGKNAVVNSGAVIGRMCIINTGAIVEHSSAIGDFSHIAIGAAICGDVSIGEHTLVGANATILQGVKIGRNSIVGAGSIVLDDVPEDTCVVGVWKRASDKN